MGSYSEARMMQNWRDHPPSSYSLKIHKNWRDHPPSSYSLKIHNFSKLENSSAFTDHKYQSRFFSSGGYNWRLIVYPKGNNKDNGSGFISMYVELDSTIAKPSTELFVELRFYIYNKKQNKYFTIQDVEVKRFNALRTVWGLKQVIACDTFKNPKYGYVFEGDQCEFGVDVNVVPPLTNWEIISFNEKFPYPKVSWKIDKFSKLKEYCTSKNISMGGTNWVLYLYPKGITPTDDRKWLSVYMYLADTEKPKAYEKIFTQLRLRVLNPLGSNHFTVELEHWFTESRRAIGWSQFLSLAKYGKVYLGKEDALNLEIKFEVVSTTKYSPTIRSWSKWLKW